MAADKKGFTFIEALVTISILVMLTSGLLLYNRTGEQQIVLLREKSSVIGLILKAKSLSINTFIADEPICGYGAHFETDSYILFKDRAIDCLASDLSYTAADSQELVEKFNLPKGLKFSNLGVQDILFVPPNPFIFFDGQRAFGEVGLTIGNPQNNSSVVLKFNSSGQISQ